MTYEPRSYRDFVKCCAETNPCLRPLAQLLDQEQCSTFQPSSIYRIDYGKEPDDTPRPEKYSLQQLMADVEKINSTSSPNSPPRPVRRIIFVEDIDIHTLQSLGMVLDIDPLFFANYLFTEYRNIEIRPAPPGQAFIPSELTDRDCVHLHYQDVLNVHVFPPEIAKPYKYTSNSNVKRPLRCPPALGGIQPGIMRGCFSALLKHFDAGSWICLVLIDRATNNVVPDSKSPHYPSLPSINLDIRLLQGGSEESIATRSFSKWSRSPRRPFPPKESFLQNLLRYYEQIPPGLDILNSNLVALIYYPLKEISSRWMLYVNVLNRYSKFYEYSAEKRMNKTLERDITDLQRWRRRAAQSIHKITVSMKFVSLNTPRGHLSEKASPETAPTG